MALIFNISEAIKQSAFNVLQEPIKMLMENETEAFEKESHLGKIYVLHTIDTYEKNFRSRTAMDNFKPTQDLEPPKLVDFQESYRKTIGTHIWTSKFVISKQTIEDNQEMEINTDAVGFIKSYHRTREDFAYAMLSGALSGAVNYGGIVFDTTGADTVDGAVRGAKQNFFHNAHKSVVYPDNSAYNQSNKFYVTDGIDYTDNEDRPEMQLLSAIGQVQSAMQYYKDDKGNVLTVNPDTILITNEYRFKDALLTALKTQYTDRMGDNGVNLQYGNWNVIISPMLRGKSGFEDADQAFVMIDTTYNKEALGAMFTDRTALEINSWLDDNTKANIWDGRARFGVNFNNFRSHAYCATGVSASDLAKADATALTTKPEAVTPAA